MAHTDPKLFGFSPDTAHLHLAGANVVEMLDRYKQRIRFLDYKDARWTTPTSDWVEESGKVHPKGFAERALLFQHLRPGRWRSGFPRLPPHTEERELSGLDLRGPGHRPQRAA